MPLPIGQIIRRLPPDWGNFPKQSAVGTLHPSRQTPAGEPLSSQMGDQGRPHTWRLTKCPAPWGARSWGPAGWLVFWDSRSEQQKGKRERRQWWGNRKAGVEGGGEGWKSCLLGPDLFPSPPKSQSFHSWNFLPTPCKHFLITPQA